MKLQCSCGAKYGFDVTPEMVNTPVKFICPSCGLDSSDFVNDLIRREFGASAPASAAPPPAAPVARLRVSADAPTAAAASELPAAAFCAKHRETATARCSVCHKPICPKCLELFGYFCSPLCRGKAEAQRLAVPEYAGRKDLAEARFWRKTGLIAGLLWLLVVLFFGAWTWYAWIGSVAHPYFAVRFGDDDRGYHGHAQLVDKDQLIALHGGTLARYDLKGKKTVWTQELITREQIDRATKAAGEAQAKANEGSEIHHFISHDAIEALVRQALQSQLTLHVSGQNVWVAQSGRLTRYDWDTGKPGHAVDLPEREGELVESGGELQMVGLVSVTHVSLAGGDVRVERAAGAAGGSGAATLANAGGGLPGTTGAGDQPLFKTIVGCLDGFSIYLRHNLRRNGENPLGGSGS